MLYAFMELVHVISRSTHSITTPVSENTSMSPKFLKSPHLLEVGWEALLLRPSIRMRVGVVLHLLLVVAHHLLFAEHTDRRLLLRLNWVAVGLHGYASACCFGLLVLAVDAIFLRDRHGCVRCWTARGGGSLWRGSGVAREK